MNPIDIPNKVNNYLNKSSIYSKQIKYLFQINQVFVLINQVYILNKSNKYLNKYMNIELY